MQKQVEFTGYASVFNNKDKLGDVILPNAIKNDNNTEPITLLLSHNNKREIGQITKYKVNANGLYVEGYINAQTPNGQEALSLIKQGFRGLSIGYYTEKSIKDKTRGVRYLSSIKIVEISLVKNPANSQAVINNL